MTRLRYSVLHKLRAVKMVEDGSSKKKVAKKFKIQRNQLTKWIKSKQLLRNTRDKSSRIRSFK